MKDTRTQDAHFFLIQEVEVGRQAPRDRNLEQLTARWPPSVLVAASRGSWCHAHVVKVQPL